MSPLSEPDLLEEEIQEEQPVPKGDDIATIYNNGVPTLVLTTEQDIYDILHGIEDPMECFPPDAQDAAELEACEAFVETMAFLAMLEEREERARNEFSHVQMRWEVRRQRGLVGRPKAAKHSILATPHLARCAVQHEERSLVKVLPRQHRILPFAPTRLTNKMKHTAMNLHAVHRPIQQPRKNN